MRCEHIGSTTLILGDACSVLPTVRADILLTDPVWPNCPAGLLAGSNDPLALWTATMGAMPAGVHRVVAVMRCDSDPRFLSPVPARLPFFRSIQLAYAVPGYLNRVLGGDETAYWFGSVVERVPGRIVIPGRAPVAQPSQRPRNGHPCSRAQVHFDWLVSWCSDAGEVVCDPFMGSGTTGVACVKIGRPFVGIEVDESYFDLACSRVEEAHRQADLFVGRVPADTTARQGSMFARATP